MTRTGISTHYLLAEGGTLHFILFLGATGNNEMFLCDYIYAIRTPLEKHHANPLRVNVLHRPPE